MYTKILLGLLVLMVCSLASCSRVGKAEQLEKAVEAAPATIKVAAATVERQDLSQTLSIAADFRPYQEIDLHAKVAGYLKEIRVDVGDRVQTGQLIATLEIPEFKSELWQAAASRKRSESEVQRAQSEVQRAQSVYNAAKLTYSRLDAVGKAKPNLLAQQEIDDALARVQVAEAQLNTTKAALDVAHDQVGVLEAGEARVKTLSAYSTITAPFSGLVTKRYADPGAMIQAGISSQTQAMPVVRLSQISSLRLILPIPESAVPRIQIGRRVAVKVSSLNQTFAGKVARFSGKIDPVTHTMETEVDVPNPRSLLKPGMYASAEIELDHKPAALTVPVQAIVRKEGKATVMVVNAKKQTEVREVVTEMETPEWVEVVSGLNEGDIVIIGNQAQLKPGQSVEAKITTLGEQKGGKH